MNEKYLKFLVLVTLFAICILVSLLGYWSFYPYKPIITSSPYTIVYPENKVVKQGGHITYEFKYDKSTDIIPVVQRQFVDGLVFNVAGLQTSSVTTKGKGVARTEIDIPETLPSGNYHVRIIATYQMNPIRQVKYETVTETFEVVPGKHVDVDLD